ncbi:MAG: CBS domain-containing protein [Actinomycetota bacterium]|nr:CBS domain-containing protein [Actinomycetota bacterium]
MSPRAAWRLESLGFQQVYDYVGGKADWYAGGLPLEGRVAGRPPALRAARTEVPTCTLAASVADARKEVEASDLDFVVALDDGVVVGRVNRDALGGLADDTPLGGILEEGPTTARASDDLGDLVERMRRAETESIILTSKEGRLLGVLLRDEAEAALEDGRSS